MKVMEETSGFLEERRWPRCTRPGRVQCGNVRGFASTGSGCKSGGLSVGLNSIRMSEVDLGLCQDRD
jgi:hypothetical protein